MIISTFGTKICDDAASYSRNTIKNNNRLVEISPFTIAQECQIPELESIDYDNYSFDNEYQKLIFGLELNNTVLDLLRDSEGFVVVDLMVCRLFFREFLLSDGRKLRMTESKALRDNLNALRRDIENSTGCKIERESCYNPIKYDDTNLRIEIKRYANLLKDEIGEGRVVLLDVRNVFQYVDKKAHMAIMPSLENTLTINEFVERCTGVFLGNINCRVIKHLDKMFGDERFKAAYMFHFNKNYYDYVNASLMCIENNDAGKLEETFGVFNVKQNMELDELIFRSLSDLVNMRRRRRKVVLLGDNAFLEYDLRKRHGIDIAHKLKYSANSTMQEIIDQMEKLNLAGKYREYICVVPYVYNSTKVLEAMWRCGYAAPNNCLIPIHFPFRLNAFVGRYEDFYGNVVEAKTPVTLEIKGAGNEVYVGESEDTGYAMFILLSQVSLKIGDGALFEGSGITSTLYDGATLYVGDNVTFGSDVHIRGSFFDSTYIGSNTEIETKSVIFNGDGHAIIDLNTGKNINYDLNNSKPVKHEIRIGNNVAVGSHSFVLSGSVIQDDSRVIDGTLVNKVFDASGCIYGQPGRLRE
ncbi:MAG: acyltransferase [Lachnospiraceae bacterium]